MSAWAEPHAAFSASMVNGRSSRAGSGLPASMFAAVTAATALAAELPSPELKGIRFSREISTPKGWPTRARKPGDGHGGRILLRVPGELPAVSRDRDHRHGAAGHAADGHRVTGVLQRETQDIEPGRDVGHGGRREDGDA